MKPVEETLQFNEIRKLLANYIHAERAQEYILALTPFSYVEELTDALAELKEMIDLIVRFSSWPLTSSADVRGLLENAKKGGILTPLELDHVAHDIHNGNDVQRFFHKLDREYPLIANIIADLFDLEPLAKAIEKVVAPNLKIFDSASPELALIRNKIQRQENKISARINQLVSHYGNLLTDNLLTLRDGHYVLPVKTAEKNKISGIIHDISDSGQTTFIEPNEIVVLNNEMVTLKNDELEEIRRILRRLTAQVIAEENHIDANNAILAQLDFLQAKARYALASNAVVADIASSGSIRLQAARHPLIDADKVVPNDFVLDEKNQIVIISGPNAGGKTVALKTVGILVYMHLCGLAVLANEGASIAFFPHIYLDIGDAQSITDNLSTFSGHLAHLVAMTKSIHHGDLVLIDELGTGTDPDEGAALAEAIVRFMQKKKVTAMISSHYSRLKIFALNQEGVINASMLFDREKLSPTYKFKLGLPGSSYGLTVAQRLGLPVEIVNDAEELLKKMGTSDIALTIQRLEENVRLAEKERIVAKEKLINLERQEKEINRQEEILRSRKQNLLEEWEGEKEQLIAEAEAKIDEIMHAANNASKPHELIAAKHQLSEMAEISDEPHTEADIVVGDYVTINSLGVLGRVIRLQGHKVVLKGLDGMSFTADLNNLVHAEAPQRNIKKKTRPMPVADQVILQNKVGLELNVIGLHVDEALNEVSHFLDACRIKHYHNVRIIHGDGSGTLRNAIQNYLKNQSFVSEYRIGGPGEGGLGATVVTLK